MINLLKRSHYDHLLPVVRQYITVILVCITVVAIVEGWKAYLWHEISNKFDEVYKDLYARLN